MKNILFTLLLMCFQITAKGQGVIEKEYFFFIDGGFLKLEQKNDVLYTFKCEEDFSCPEEPEKEYKIISTSTMGGHKVLKLEHLYPTPDNGTKYSLLTLANINDKSLSYITNPDQYTRNQIDTIQVSRSDVEGKFGFTFYTKEYLKQLEKGKQLSSKAEIEAVLISLGNPEYQAVVRQYNQRVVERLYGSGVTDEIWYRALIKEGYNPLGSKDRFEQLMR